MFLKNVKNLSSAFNRKIHCKNIWSFRAFLSFDKFQIAKLSFTSVASHVNPKYVNTTLILFRGSEGESIFNYSTETSVEILRLMGTFSFSLQKTKDDNDFENEVMKSTVNMCKLEKGVRANFLTKMMMENFKNSSDFSLKCPMKPGRTSLTNFKMSEHSFPSYLLMSYFKFMIQLKLQSKIPKVKSLVYFQTLKFYGEVEKG